MTINVTIKNAEKVVLINGEVFEMKAKNGNAVAKLNELLFDEMERFYDEADETTQDELDELLMAAKKKAGEKAGADGNAEYFTTYRKMFAKKYMPWLVREERGADAALERRQKRKAERKAKLVGGAA
jgi:hypothetical protein